MPVYEPSEDSWLLEKAVKKYAAGKVLDVGTGSGIQAIAARAMRRVKTVTAIDIQPDVIASCKKANKGKRITWLQSDLFSALKGKRFDTIIFNPPYLPADGGPPNLALIGGKKGYETLERFLDEAGDHLTPNGRILILFSSHTKKEMIDRAVKRNLFTAKGEAEQHIGGFETLYVYMLQKTPARREIDRHVQNLKAFDEGWRGAVLTGSRKGKKIAVKVRLERARHSKSDEAKWLTLANKHGIGPKLILRGRGWLAYEFAEGEPISKWLKHAKRDEIVRVLVEVLKQCHKLDLAEIAKEEMSNPYKHVLVWEPMTKGRAARKRLTKNASLSIVLIDFERAHKTTKPKNVTQFCSYIINLNRSMKLGMDDNKLIEAARRYSVLPNNKTFRDVRTLIV